MWELVRNAYLTTVSNTGGRQLSSSDEQTGPTGSDHAAVDMSDICKPPHAYVRV